jgi:hypothetical protein
MVRYVMLLCKKMAVFWVVAQCSLVDHRDDDGGSKDF